MKCIGTSNKTPLTVTVPLVCGSWSLQVAILVINSITIFSHGIGIEQQHAKTGNRKE